MDQVKCTIEVPSVEGLKPSDLTVGRHVILNCEGSWDKLFDFSKAQFKLDENQKFILKIFKAEARDAQSFDVNMTIYSGSSLKFPELVITDGNLEISLGNQNFEVKSVIEAQANSQPPKPYGMILPLRLTWPTLYFVIFGTAIVLFLVGLIWKLRRAARYSRLIADLQNYHSPIAIDLQFYKSLRQAEKSQYPLADLENAFRLFILRTYQVPMFALNNRQIARFFKKRNPLLKNEKKQIEKILSEFEEIQNRKKELTFEEKQELVHKLYRFVESTQQSLAQRSLS